MGRGYSWWGMEEIIRLAFEEYELDSVYWCVSRANDRAKGSMINTISMKQ